MGIALVRENGGAIGARSGINKMQVGTQSRQNIHEIYTNGEHMVAGLEVNKRRDFTINNIQGQEVIMAKFECRTWLLGISEVMWM